MLARRYAPIAAALTVLGLGNTTAVAGDRHDSPPATFVGQGPAPARREVPAGAAYYLHFGPTGLCVIGDGFDWGQVPAGDMVLFESTRVLAIDGSDDFDTLVEIQPLDQGTATSWDDQLRVTVTMYSEVDSVVEQVFPMWDTDGSGTIDGKATANTPQSLYLKRIEFQGAVDGVQSAVINNSRVPMHATGRFSQVASGENGFLGGDGPDCVEASLLDDVVVAGGGDDWVRAKSGNDTIVGGGGNDTIEGSSGNDVLYGDDVMIEDGGVDLLRGGSNDDCHVGGQDGLRDVLDDDDNYDFDVYVAEAGTVDGEAVDNIEIITDVGALLADGCI